MKNTLSFNLSLHRSDFTLEMTSTLNSGINVFFGPSGSGKTTFLRILSGLEPEATGFIEFENKIFLNSSQNIFLNPQERSIGYVAQHDSLFPNMNVLQNVLFGAQRIPKSQRMYRAMALLNKVGVAEKAHLLPAKLSGGQKQRVALARAFVSNPSLLALDEPFSALDSPTRIRLGELVRDFQKEHQVPVVLVTHDLFDVFSLAHHLCICSNGTIVQQGTPEQILANPMHNDVRDLVTYPRFVELQKTMVTMPVR